MNSAFTIIGVGNPIVDSIAKIEEAFLQNVEGDKGGMVLTDPATISALIEQIPQTPHSAPGGSAGNTIFALAKMGIQTRFLGKTGNCEQGDFYRSRFSELGGDTSRFKIGEMANGHCLSMVTPDGERTMRTDLGAAMTLTPDEISPADFAECNHAHIEGYLLFNPDLMQRVLKSAKEAGCSVSLDLASFEVVNAAKDVLPHILENYVDLVFANEEEGHVFTGLGNSYAAMALELAKHCDVAAIKVGAHGSYVAHGDTVEKAEPMHAAHIVDTTAAGDLWAAGFLYGWSHKRALIDCARIGSILGAAVVQEQGSELPEHVWNDILSTI
ncbi:MAG: adenosine kinase [Verrucomicrobiota bacterium]